MTRRSLGFLVLSLLLALPTLAQSGDLTVSFTSETRISDPSYYTYNVTLAWTGDEPARDVVIEFDVPGALYGVFPHGTGMNCTSTNPIRCTLPLMSRDDMYIGVGVQVSFPAAGTYVATAKVSTSTAEGSTENNTATHALAVTGLPDMWGSLIAEHESIDPNGEATFRMGISNGGAPATNIVVHAKIEDGGTILKAEPTDWGFGPPTSTCTIDHGEATCRIPEMSSRDFELVRLTYRAPNRREGGKAVASATITSDQEDFEPLDNSFRTDVPLRRMFVVTSTDNEGSGTLRQAILEANAACETLPCTIAFEGLTVVQPRTPLPGMHGRIRVDGGAARVLLDGSLQPTGNALQFDGGCSFDVRNLYIRNFPGHGIEAQSTEAGNFPCYNFGERGFSVWRTVLSDNERGIVAKGIDASLRENVVHDHRRAGIFIDGSYYSEIFNNVVVNNGASGIYVNTSTESRFGGIPPGADIVENVVHGNGEWGIVRTRNNGLVQMRRNSTIRNGLYGIDVGLDLSTPNRENDTGGGVPNKPLLESAAYDPASDSTVVTVVAPWGSSIDLYASSSLSRYGHPESELYLGQAYVLQTGRLEFRVPGDLRGQWITGTITRSQTLFFLRDAEAKPRSDLWRPPTGFDTSELSDPVQVR
jgi:parallel beta-helix repeat protein